MKTLGVDGTFRVDPTVDTRLRVDTIVTTEGSRFEIGNETEPVRSGVTAEIEFVDNGAVTRDDDPFLVGRGLITRGEVEMVGTEKSAWHTLEEPPTKGSTSFTLSEEPTNWSAGDRVVTPGLGAYPDEQLDHMDEERVISRIEGNTIHFDEPLDYDHVPPETDLDTYLLNLTRNIRLRSENTALEHRGHFMMMNERENVLKYIQINDMGRTDKSKSVNVPLWHRGESSTEGQDNPRARYSLHFHRTGITPKRHLVKGCVVWNDPGLGYVVHDSCADLEDNIAYRVTGSGFFTEKGTEFGSFRRNFALRSWGSGEQADSRKGWSNSGGTKFLDPPDNIDDWGHTGHGFWFQSPMVSVEENVAAGHRAHGFIFWFRWLYEQPLERDENGNFVEKMDGKNTLRANVPKQFLDDREKRFGMDGSSPREHSKPHYVRDSDLYYNDTLPIRSFSDNEAFGCGAGVSYRSTSFRNREPEPPNWMRLENFTAYNIGEHWLEDGTPQGQFNNFESSGNVGVDHRYVNAVLNRNFRLLGNGVGIGIYNNRSYNDNFAVRDTEIRNWDVGFVPGREKSTNEHVVKNCTFAENNIDVLLPEIYGEPESQTWLRNTRYSGNVLIEWEEIGYGRATKHKGTSIIPRRVLGNHSQITWEGRTVYHGWSDPDFVFIEADDEERKRIVEDGKTREKWKEVTSPDDPADVIPGATHRELYDNYGITFFGGLLDRSKGEERDDLVGTSPTGDGKYMRDPFLGPLKPSMPTDEIWVDVRKTNFSGEVEMVDSTDSGTPQGAIDMANEDKLVKVSTSSGNGVPPDPSSGDGLISYKFEVSKSGPYEVYLRYQCAKKDGVNNAHRQTYTRFNGGSWIKSEQGGGGDKGLKWIKIAEKALSEGTHTIDVGANRAVLPVRADWMLIKHDTVAANPFDRGLDHTGSS